MMRGYRQTDHTAVHAVQSRTNDDLWARPGLILPDQKLTEDMAHRKIR